VDLRLACGQSSIVSGPWGASGSSLPRPILRSPRSAWLFRPAGRFVLVLNPLCLQFGSRVRLFGLSHDLRAPPPHYLITRIRSLMG